MKRYFELVDAKPSKFWEVWIEDSTVYNRFGKIGATGQTTVKEFPSTDAAQAALEVSVAEKLREGYIEGGDFDTELREITGILALLRTLPSESGQTTRLNYSIAKQN